MSWGQVAMTSRVYLAAVRVSDGAAEPGDLPAERVFIHATELPELWVETESRAIPDRGRVASFVLARPMGIGVNRISGTVERVVHKQTSPSS